MMDPLTVASDGQSRATANDAAVLLHEAGAAGATAAELTVAIPTFRRPALLLQAVQSVARQTSLQGVELLIVDNDPEGDCSGLLEQLRQLKLPPWRYVRNQENVGMFGNWNRCISLCRTEWLTILNDDDLLLPDFVEEMRRLWKTADSMAYACRCQVLDERPVEKRGYRRLNLINRLRALQSSVPVRRYGPLDYFIKNRHYGSLGIVFRRRTALEQAGFIASFYPSADYNFFSSLSIHGGVSMLQKPLAVYRIAVNESLKLETIERWREIDATIRRQLAQHIQAPGWIKAGYIQLAATHDYLARIRESKLPVLATSALRQRVTLLRATWSLRLVAWALRAHHWALSQLLRKKSR